MLTALVQVKNSLDVAFSKFEAACNDPLFEKASFYLVLNKTVCK